jgi:ATP-dependent protease ClpP protease subunit
MKLLLAMMLLLPTLSFGKTINLTDKNSINFNDSFSAQFVAKKQIEAINLCNKNGGNDIFIVLYTPGGSISAGQLFYDTLNALPCKFHTITIFAASMGYQTVQNLGRRYVLPSGTLMSHRASISGLSGELGGELDSILSLLNQNVTEMEVIASKRVGLSLKQYRSAISDELWLTGKSAVTSGHADEVALVSCGKSLMGTRMETVNTFFGKFLVEYSNCPIITAPLRVERGNGQKFYDYLSNIKKRIKFSL